MWKNSTLNGPISTVDSGFDRIEHGLAGSVVARQFDLDQADGQGVAYTGTEISFRT
jgi:hypothetical protein